MVLVAGHPARHAARLAGLHRSDAEERFANRAAIGDFVGAQLDARFVCGPTGFMDTVVAAGNGLGIDDGRVHQERFDRPQAKPVAAPRGPASASATGIVLTFRLGNETATAARRHGATLLQAARGAGLRSPSPCETGTCATCMARITEGEVRMRNNEMLTAGEMAEGWILTCQAQPLTPAVAVVHE